jgi:hypothetical protein
VDGSEPSEEIDFEKSLGYDNKESTAALSFRWRYSRNWSLWGQYWDTSSDGSGILTEDVEWEDVTFNKGTYAKSGVDFSITRIFFGRSIWQKPGHELGVGGGVHWMDIDAFIEGQVDTGTTTKFSRETASTSVPLPNIGTWYMYSWSPDWLIHARLDWLRASTDSYSGGLWHSQMGIHYQISEIFGVGLSFSNFRVDLEMDNSDWHGHIETDQYGPRLGLTASW